MFKMSSVLASQFGCKHQYVCNNDVKQIIAIKYLNDNIIRSTSVLAGLATILKR